MPSSFGWLDTDDEQRRKMIAVVELFKDEGTVDELGFGSIRDAVADALFPGTSVLHTRARYLLMIPWLLEETGRRGGPVEARPELLRTLEKRLIHSLLASGETDGVIGQQARDKLKRMPSAAYWAALGTFGLRTVPGTTIEGHLRLDAARRQARARSEVPDDPGARGGATEGLLHPDLPPAPADLLQSATLSLTEQERDFLSTRIRMNTKGSLFAWLLAHGSTGNAEEVWTHPAASSFPEDLAEVVDTGRRFASAIHGAPLLYNRLLAEKRDSESLVERYADQLGVWAEELAASRPFAGGWTERDLWGVLERRGRTPRTPTVLFTTRWLRAVQEHGPDCVGRDEVRRLVRERELALKGGRARLANPSALEAWRGASGLVRLDYRWRVARRLIDDVCLPATAAQAA